MSTLSPVLLSTPVSPSVLPPALPSARGRTLALAVEYRNDLAGGAQATSTVLAEVLLRFSPRISTRVAGTKLWFFLDLGSHVSWIERTFGDEVALAESILKTLGSLNHQARIAIADTPQAAQAFASQHGFWISSPGRTRHDLDRLPLSSMLHLEGLETWTHPARVEAIANFFALLGFQTLGDIGSFTEASFHERWGALGEKVYRRLQGLEAKDPQPIAPFIPTEALRAFVHLDHPVSVVSLLLHEVETAMKTLFARLEGRRLVVRRLRVVLRCEYSNHEHVFAIEPSVPTREIRFFRLLLENRLDRVELLNPIKDLELEIDPLPENERQEGFDNQATLDQTKLSLLTSLLSQEGAQGGFASLQDDVWPENTWTVNPEASRTNAALAVASVCAQGEGAQGEFDQTGFQPKFRYAATLDKAPRPALLLKKPRPMEEREISQLRFYSNRPIERIEHGWWEGRAGPPGTPTPGLRRDYYIAKDQGGRNLWLFRDQDAKFFLHGAFD